MVSLLDLLNGNIFAGITGNFAWELVKKAWEKANDKSWEELYIESFKAAVKEDKPRLKRYTSDGDVELDSTQLSRALRQDLLIPVEATTYSTLSTDEFARELSKVMAQQHVLLIGGHTLSEEDYAQLVRNVVKKSIALFKGSILSREAAFRRAILDEALSNHKLLRDVQGYLSDQFSLSLDFLTRILDWLLGC
jgi:hypothetical protein